jgi:preprotein translocase subunit YajC
MLPQSVSAVIAAASLAQESNPTAGAAPASAPQPAAQAPVIPGTGPDGASTTAAPGIPTPGPQPGPGAGGFGMFGIMIVVMVVFLLMTTMAGRKEKKKRAALLANVKRGDRVQTIGGEIGSIVELSDTEMVLRVDEASNTRIRFARSALQQVLREGKAAEDAKVRPEPTPAR